VLLSGWGGDEGISFNGRGYYPELLRSGRVGRLWRELRERSRHPLAAFVRTALLPAVFPGAARAVVGPRRGEWLFRKKPAFIHPEFARRAPPLPEPGMPSRNGTPNLRARLLRRGHLSERMEDWAASGARHGIEYRYPLLDRRVLEFAVGLPPEQFRRGRWSRWLMRRALDPVLPPEVCWKADKADPPQFESTREALTEALVRSREIIREREAVLSRARYLDLPRLLENLDAERWRAGRRRAPLLNALRFLDF
jgi:asparagine synthase (glutamine-hydrolysing)